ncbi:hypothetical protein HK405_012325 [Cladochytrium tenue]|nr:hypothetical protein HK405_012325 [Cladochytrium tenue]
MTLSAHLIGQKGSHASSKAKQLGPRRSERLRHAQPSAKVPAATGRTAKPDDSEGVATARKEPRGSRTAAKRRKTNVGSAAEGPTAKLTDLPLTLVATIVELVGPTAALALSRSCKVVRDVLDPREVIGKRTWRKVREADGWPDPAAIAMSDYTFLTSMFGRGCNFCSEHPRVKKAYFEFLGFRLCPTCFRRHAIRRKDQQKEVSGIPSLWLSSTRSGRRKIEYFFSPDVDLMNAPERMDETARQRLALRYARQYKNLAAYEEECEKLNQFGLRSQAALKKAVAREVDKGRMGRAGLANQRFRLHLGDRCRLLNIDNEPPAPVVNEFLPEDELALIVDQAITSEAKSRLRERWLKQHASSTIDSANFAAVQKLAAYVSAQPDDEPAFLEQLAQARAEIPPDLHAALESEEALRGKPDSHRDAILRDTVNAAVKVAAALTGEAAVAVSDRAETLLHTVGQEAFDRSLTEGILFCLRCSKHVNRGATRSMMLLHRHTDSTDYGVFYWVLSSPPPPESVLSRYPEHLRQVEPPQPVGSTTNRTAGPAGDRVAVHLVRRELAPGKNVG